MPYYPTKTSFYKPVFTTNDYGEPIATKGATFTTGSRVVTMSFKDRFVSNQAVDTTALWVYIRRNTNTLAVAVGDYVTLPLVSSDDYKVLGVDPKLSQRGELLFLVEKVEGVALNDTTPTSNALVVDGAFFITSGGDYFILQEA